MSRLWRTVVCAALALSAACDRAVYVGRDAPLALAEIAGAAPPAVQPPSTDAGNNTQELVAETNAPAPQAEAMPAPPTCEALHEDCDGESTNGCEADLMHDRNHCGACGARCETPDCSCDNGKLALHCDSGHADCDTMLSNGCETDVARSMQHCGACQRTCHANGHDATSAVCIAGRCDVSCEPRISPEEDCDGNPDNGCESYLLFDAKNCGQCGNVCVRCEAGMCVN